MKIAFQIDSIVYLKLKTDTTLIIMQEALKRGFDVWFYHPSTLTYKNGEVFSSGFKFNGKQEENGTAETLVLDSFNYIFLRQDPPFDMNYLTTTYLLEK